MFDRSGHLVHFDVANEPHAHPENFIDCIRSRKMPNGDIETGHISTTLSHFGNIVARTGRHLHFDGERGAILGDEEGSPQNYPVIDRGVMCETFVPRWRK